MRRIRPVLASALALVMLLATPLASIAGCTVCPPDCPMHAQAIDEATEPGGDGAHAHHSLHGAAHGEHGAHAMPADHAGHADHAGFASPEGAHAGHHGAHEPAASPALVHDGYVRAGDASSRALRAALSAGRDGDCHSRARAARAADDGPCLTAACGHHEVVLAPVLPEALPARAAQPGIAPDATTVVLAYRPLVAVDPPDPPTDPPRSLLG